MSEQLSKLSVSVALELRTQVQESKELLQKSEKIITALKKAPVIVNGTRNLLDDIVNRLRKMDEQHIGLLQQINETYGTPAAGQKPESE